MTNIENEKLYTTREVAKIFAVKDETIRAWYRQGKLTASIKLPGGVLRFTAADLKAFASRKFDG